MNLGKKIITLIGIFTLVYFLVTTTAIADGCYFSEEYFRLNEPLQKAVIYWNGETEIMILSSSVRADNLTDFAWIVPIISTTIPNVTAGNISLFEDLVRYFLKPSPRNPYSIFSTDNNKMNNVTVIEIKEIDIYDIIIIKASNTTDLTDWLLENNFKIPEESYDILEGYVNQDNCYFVINKIDLKNRFRDVIEDLENGTKPSDIPNYKNYSDTLFDLRNGMSTPLEFKFTPPEPYYPLTISSFSKGYGSIQIYVIAECPVTDKNHILTLDKCKSISDKLKEKIGLHIPIEKAYYVTRLTYRGKLSKLSNDAVFKYFPLKNPEKPISIHTNSDIEFVIAEHHIWGLVKNLNIIEIQYRFDDEKSWKVANGTYIWSIDLNPLNLDDGKHTVYFRVLKYGFSPENMLPFNYSKITSYNFLTQNGIVVENMESFEQGFIYTGLFLSGMVILALVSIAIINHKIKF
jgi:hypothetical protein